MPAPTVEVDVTAAAIQLLVANGDRKAVSIVNQGSGPVFLSDTSAVTATTGFRIPAGMGAEITGDTGDVWAIAASGTQTVAVTETLSQ